MSRTYTDVPEPRYIDSDIIHLKTFTITINTRGWVITDVVIEN